VLGIQRLRRRGGARRCKCLIIKKFGCFFWPSFPFGSGEN